MDNETLKKRLTEKGLRITGRRLALLKAVIELNHPSADEIIACIRRDYPDTATATVYKALNVLAGRKVIFKVNTERDVIRYDAVTEPHHHLYCPEIDKIRDYRDKELEMLLTAYFEKKKISGFRFEDVKIQIIGQFTDL